MTRPPAADADPHALEPDSFAYFYRREYAKVYALCHALAGAAAADDLAQEAFLRAHRLWERIVAYDVPAAWVRRVAINLATSLARRVAAESRAITLLAGHRETARHIDPEPIAVDDELWRVVRSLPARQSSVVVLHYVEDMSVDQIAELLGLTANTVKVHLHRARNTLARKLAPMPEQGGAHGHEH